LKDWQLLYNSFSRARPPVCVSAVYKQGWQQQLWKQHKWEKISFWRANDHSARQIIPQLV